MLPAVLSTENDVAVDVEQRIERSIHLVRDLQVMPDADLAKLYGVATKDLNRAVKRNAERFPPDFMFRLTAEEAEVLRRQIGASKLEGSDARGGRRYLPFVFTELGVAMLSSVLTSSRAVQMNIAIMRTFVRLRQITAVHWDLERRIEHIELRQQEHESMIGALAEEIGDLRQTPEPSRRRIGF